MMLSRLPLLACGDSLPRRNRGFTIIEMMMTVVILGILAMLAIPSFNDLILSTRIKGGASDIYSALILARSEAIKRGTNVTITPTSGLWTNGWQVAVGGTVLRNQDALSKLTVECPSGTACNQTLTFQRNGRLSGTSTVSIEVYIQDAPATRRVAMRCVSVSVSGQVNVLADNNLDGNCANG